MLAKADSIVRKTRSHCAMLHHNLSCFLKTTSLYFRSTPPSGLLLLGQTPSTRPTVYCGGGSAALNLYYTITPFYGVQVQCTAAVDFAQGVYGTHFILQMDPLLRARDGKQGFHWRVFNEPPTTTDRKLLKEKTLTYATAFFIDSGKPYRILVQWGCSKTSTRRTPGVVLYLLWCVANRWVNALSWNDLE